MKTFRQHTVESLGFKDRVKEAVWKGWKEDGYFSPPEDHWNDLGAEDHDEFHRHVRAVIKHAEHHKIKNATKALNHFTDSIHNDFVKDVKKSHH